ncbi:MAG TPA: 2'-5' RNA ligase family protein [Gemmatimonadaceae bacterium]|nr:2'-5' RNA ligase family protein [Gemmatimonadaceae bacterium]
MGQDLLDHDEWGDEEEWRGPPTIFILIEVRGAAGEQLAEIQRRFDPKLAARSRPHLTLTGSSGVGAVPGSIPVELLAKALEPVAATTRPFEAKFGPAERFMQTNTVVLPLDPHGPVRDLHDRVARSGLPFGPAKFTFTPHVTLNYFATLTKDAMEQLLRTRIDEPLRVDHLQCSLARDPERPIVVFELPLLGSFHPGR